MVGNEKSAKVEHHRHACRQLIISCTLGKQAELGEKKATHPPPQLAPVISQDNSPSSHRCDTCALLSPSLWEAPSWYSPKTTKRETQQSRPLLQSLGGLALPTHRPARTLPNIILEGKTFENVKNTADLGLP